MTSNQASLVGAGAILLWAVLALLFTLAAPLPPMEIMAIGFAVSALCGLAYLIATDRLADLRQPPLAWAHGVGGLFFYHAFYFAALALAPLAPTNLLNYLWPLLTLLFAVPLLGLVLRRAHWLGITLGLGGYLVLFSSNRAASMAPSTAAALLGYCLAVGAAVIWALYSVLSRRFAYVPTGAIAGFSAAAALLAALAHLAFETSVAPSLLNWLALLLLGVGPLGGAFYLWDIGMKRGDPRLLGTLAYATPVCSTLLLCLAGKAAFSSPLIVASLLVGAGGLVASRGGA
jgi:drug/metabolite transporter (DMT)-like permease